MRPASDLAAGLHSPKAATLSASASANFHKTIGHPVNRGPVEAGNIEMLCPSIGACNKNNFCESLFGCCDAVPRITHNSMM
jgi:hypothetical protein